jgi:hypothetical protein
MKSHDARSGRKVRDGRAHTDDKAIADGYMAP